MNPEPKAFYKLPRHYGASQSDLAGFNAEYVDWEQHVISFARKKDRINCHHAHGSKTWRRILRDLPEAARCFRTCAPCRSGDRATEFHQRCVGLGIKGVTLHSYRYAWAERAKTAGYPERYAQVNLSLAMKPSDGAGIFAQSSGGSIPSLSEYERQQKTIIGNRNPRPAAKAA